jgi:hypothetical protein
LSFFSFVSFTFFGTFSFSTSMFQKVWYVFQSFVRMKEL